MAKIQQLNIRVVNYSVRVASITRIVRFHCAQTGRTKQYPVERPLEHVEVRVSSATYLLWCLFTSFACPNSAQPHRPYTYACT